MSHGVETNEWVGWKGAVGGFFLASPLRRAVDLVTGNSTGRALGAMAIAGDERVVEAGAGSGYFSLLVAERLDLGELLCVDGSPVMAGLLRRRLRARGLEQRVRVELGEVTSLPAADGGADLAFAANVLHELADPARAAAELARVVRPGGRVVVVDFADVGGSRERVRRGHHAGAHGVWTAAELASLLEGVGLRDVGVDVSGRWLVARAVKVDGAAPGGLTVGTPGRG